MSARRLVPVAGARAPRGERQWLALRSDGLRYHAGVDLGAALETVRAPADLEIVETGEASYADDQPRRSYPPNFGGYGPRWILALDGTGFWHLFAHLGRVDVTPGQLVRVGETIGQIAQRGGHLHWEVRTRRLPPAGRQVIEIALDPMEWIEGRSRAWDPELDGCPPASTRSPRACVVMDGAPTPAQARSGPWSANFWGGRPARARARRRASEGVGPGGLLILGAVGLAVMTLIEEPPRSQRKR